VGLCNPPLCAQARHLLFDQKQETGRERVPSAPLAFLWMKQETIRGQIDSTTWF